MDGNRALFSLPWYLKKLGTHSEKVYGVSVGYVSSNFIERVHACMQMVPPEVKDTPEAPKQAKEKLRQMGPMTRDELIMSFTMLGAVILWVLGDQLQIPAVTAAMLGLTALLMTGVLQWKDCLNYSQACNYPSLLCMERLDGSRLPSNTSLFLLCHDG